MAITFAQMCGAVKSHLETAASLERSSNYDEMTEGMQDTPTLEVYPESSEPVSFGGTSQAWTVQSGVIQGSHTIHADLYANQRSHLGEDMTAMVTGLDEVYTLLENAGCPPFGLEGIKSYQFGWMRVLFKRGGVDYVGARFTIVLRTF